MRYVGVTWTANLMTTSLQKKAPTPPFHVFLKFVVEIKKLKYLYLASSGFCGRFMLSFVFISVWQHVFTCALLCACGLLVLRILLCYAFVQLGPFVAFVLCM